MSTDFESHYHIAQGENVQGPYTLPQVLELVVQGKARPEMLYSRDGADWVEGYDLSELFPQAAPAAAPPPPGRAGGDNPGLHRDGARRSKAAPSRGRARQEDHRGGLILALGIIALVVGCGLIGIFPWVMGNTDLAKMRAGRMDRSGEGLTNAGRILGIIAVVLVVVVFVVFFVLGAGGAVMSSVQDKPY